MGAFLSASASGIDSSIVNELINLCKSCMGLFREFPMNVLLVAGLIGIGFRIFRNAKGSVQG